MPLLADVLNLFNAPAPTPQVEVARASVNFSTMRSSIAGELELTQSCVQLVERDEGDRLTAYPDPATHGDPWTIGYGHTGPDVTPGLTITQDQAVLLLRSDLDKFEEGVKEKLTGDTSDNQFSAMVSLAYNVGLGNFRSSSVLRFHNEGQYAQAADAFLLWDKAAGQVMAGLLRRRHQERELYLGLAIDP